MLCVCVRPCIYVCVLMFTYLFDCLLVSAIKFVRLCYVFECVHMCVCALMFVYLCMHVFARVRSIIIFSQLTGSRQNCWSYHKGSPCFEDYVSSIKSDFYWISQILPIVEITSRNSLNSKCLLCIGGPTYERISDFYYYYYMHDFKLCTSKYRNAGDCMF